MPGLRQAGEGICNAERTQNEYQTQLLCISAAASELAGWQRRWEASSARLDSLFAIIESRLSANDHSTQL